MKLKTKIFIKTFSKLLLLAIAFPLTMICVILGAYEHHTATFLFGVAGYLIVMLAAEYLAD